MPKTNYLLESRRKIVAVAKINTTLLSMLKMTKRQMTMSLLRMTKTTRRTTSKLSRSKSKKRKLCVRKCKRSVSSRSRLRLSVVPNLPKLNVCVWKRNELKR